MTQQDSGTTSNTTTPDTLMEQFKGKGLVSIMVFTVVVHIVLIVGSSLPYLARSIFSPDNSKLSEEERIKSAVEDATAALRDIAEEHGLNPQDISSQFAGGRSRAAKSSAAAVPATETPPDAEPDREKSAYETNLETKAEGPAVPTFEDEGDDIF